jgi:hypothetical protein
MKSNRDQVLSFISPRWVKIEQILDAATSASSLQGALFERFIGAGPISHTGLDILFNNAGSLFLFIKDDSRYKGDAIEVASAMTGVPEMEPRISYDYFLAKKNRGKFWCSTGWGARSKRQTNFGRQEETGAPQTGPE